MIDNNWQDREDQAARSPWERGETFDQVFKRRVSRRTLLKGVAAGSAAVATGGSSLVKMVLQVKAAAPFPLGFTPIAGNTTDTADVPDRHVVNVLLRWGDPLTDDAPEFDPHNLTRAAQEKQFGYNCDFVGYFPIDGSSEKGLLAVNHEYTNPKIMFRNYNLANVTQEQVDVEMAAHGVTVVEIERGNDGRWTYNRSVPVNRRYTLFSEIEVTGPAAGHVLLQTGADAAGSLVQGVINNCSGGKTPWGTFLTSEENFQDYFVNQAAMPEDTAEKLEIKNLHGRYSLVKDAFGLYNWAKFYDRFDAAKEPHEAFRFGWGVEIDPFDPDWKPKKRTALGRFRHEACTVVSAPSGQVVVYMGDDARFEYIYKYVSHNIATGDRETDRDSDLLDNGVLYVAKFNDDGSGAWLPLVFRQNGLEGTVRVRGKDYTFNSQGDIAIKTRLAADFLGATKMDRPEDMETNPVTGKIYAALTNNTGRDEDRIDPANPRGPNPYGHIIEITEDHDDPASETFRWEIFMLCGPPSDPDSTFAGFDKDALNDSFSGIAAPDNITFDDQGNLWIATDGQPGTLNLNDGLFAVPTEGPDRGHIGQFFSAVIDCEVCGPEFTPDNKTLFIAIQHPGAGGNFDNPTSRFPDYDPAIPPRPSVITVQTLERDGTLGSQKVGRLGPPRRLYLPAITNNNP